MNPAEWLVRTATRSPEAPALMVGKDLWSDYAGFCGAAARIGGALTARGIGPGSRVAIFMKNRAEYLEAMYGIWFAGATVVPINGKLHVKEAAWIAAHAEVALILTDAASAGELVAVQGDDGPPMSLVDTSEFTDLKTATPLPAPLALDTADTAWLFYTSGTTGRPKGVMITAGNLMTMALSYFADVDDVLPEDATLYSAPMSHAAGIYNFMYVMRGARHVIPPSGGFDPAEILELAPKLGSVTMFAAPTMVRRLVDVAREMDAPGDGIRTIAYAGGPMYEADIIDAVNHFGPRFVQVYGQGECPMAITALSRHDIADRTHPRWRQRLNSVGVAQSCGQVAIFDPEGRPLPPGDIGEIVVKGPVVMGGYWRNAEATAKTIKDGWLWTGDLGSLDADGYLTMQDRSKDLIITGGSNVYPREVEEVLLQHPALREVAVVGQPHPEWGEDVVAFIVTSQPVDPAELDQLCLDNIARFKRPKRYLTLDELPKNNYGKVLKTELRARLLGPDG